MRERAAPTSLHGVSHHTTARTTNHHHRRAKRHTKSPQHAGRHTATPTSNVSFGAGTVMQRPNNLRFCKPQGQATVRGCRGVHGAMSRCQASQMLKQRDLNAGQCQRIPSQPLCNVAA